jgi:hypothetical protein
MKTILATGNLQTLHVARILGCDDGQLRFHQDLDR